jgi:hypothetical protein
VASAAEDDLRLLRAYEPVLRYTRGELFLPMSVELYLSWCSLWLRPDDSRRRRQIAAAGELDPDRLAELGRRHTGQDLSLRLVGEPLGRRELRAWRRSPERPRFRPSARFAAVGLLGRFIESLMRLSLVFRGRVPGGTAASAAARYRRSPERSHHPYYGRVTRDAGYLVLQYWFFYAMNDWRTTFTGVNDHEADWEQVTVFLPAGADGTQRPAWVAFSSHDEEGADLRRRGDDPDISWVGNHPVVFAGAGSHSGAYLPGEYLVSVQPAALRKVTAAVRAVRERLFGWTLDRPASPLGIPFVDYRRGDGVGLGPGYAQGWSPVLIDDTTPWVRHYRGLWGLDTSDPLGGERAPAGPRYERSGARRVEWADPVGWAALDAEPPSEADGPRLLAERHAELQREIDRSVEELWRTRAELRRATAGARAVRSLTGRDLPADDLTRALADQRRHLTALEQERAAVTEALRTELPRDHPHRHLSHRPVPDIDPLRSPSRLAHAWSMASVSVLLLGMAAVVLSRSALVWAEAIAALIVGALLLEALARGRLTRWVLNTLVPVLILGAATVLVVAFVLNWRYGVAALLASAAVLLLVTNLRDVLSKR